jgi:uncharacterized protein YmfQ (DUF2313 family)
LGIIKMAISGRSAADYTEHLKGLLPFGKAWTRDPDSVLSQLLNAIAYELARLDSRAYELLEESNPANSTELLDEYEEEFNIISSSTLTETRQGVVAAKTIELGGLSKEYYISVAAALGYSISFYEFAPFWVGIMTAVDPVGDQKNIFVFLVWANTNFDCGGFECGFDEGFSAPASLTDIDPVCSMTRNLDALISEIDRIKPAHACALYEFYGRSFSRGFSWGFPCIPYHDGIVPIPGFTSGFDSGFAAITEYEGSYLVGGFDKTFSLGFDVCHGGGFIHDGFDSGFDVPR